MSRTARRRWRRRPGRPALALAATVALALGGALAPPAAAETAWVADRLLLGVHTEAGLDSAIVKVIPSGTELEILERQGPLARVRTPDGTTGWVDGAYLAEEAPAAVELETLRERVRALEAAGREAEAARAEAEDRARAALEALERERERAATLAEAEQAARARAEEARRETPPPAPAAAPIPSETLREMQRLAEENQRLKAELEAALAEARAAPGPPADRAGAAGADSPAGAAPLAAVLSGARPAGSAPGAPRLPGFVPEPLARWLSPYLGILAWEHWQWLLLAGALLLAFGAGAWLVDWSTRRRHGGFRI